MPERHVRQWPGHVQGMTEVIQVHAAIHAVHHSRRRERATGDPVVNGGVASDAFERERVGKVRFVGFGRERVRWSANWKGLLMRRVMVVRLRERRHRPRCSGCSSGGIERHGDSGGGGGGGGGGDL